MKKRIGLIARYDNSGLGTLSWEFARHLKPHKVLLVQNFKYKLYPTRYQFLDHQFYNERTPLALSWFTRDIDVLLTFETPYDWGIIRAARRYGIKTVLCTMYEMTPEKLPASFDHYLCPSKLDFDVMPEPKTYLPIPLATDRLRWKKRDTARTFIHTASHGGVKGRKGTQLFLDAIPMVSNPDVRFTIFTWKEMDYRIPDDKRLTIKHVEFENYWQAWREGDVLVYPQDYNGICLPVIEAMASGLGVISTNIYPFNEYLPKEMLFEPVEMYRTRAAPKLMSTDAARINPSTIAMMINRWALRDISEFSEYGRKYAEAHSWDVLLQKYERFFDHL